MQSFLLLSASFLGVGENNDKQTVHFFLKLSLFVKRIVLPFNDTIIL